MPTARPSLPSLLLPGFGTTYYAKPLAYRQVYVNYYKDPNFLASTWDQAVALAATQPLAAAQVRAPQNNTPRGQRASSAGLALLHAACIGKVPCALGKSRSTASTPTPPPYRPSPRRR